MTDRELIGSENEFHGLAREGACPMTCHRAEVPLPARFPSGLGPYSLSGDRLEGKKLVRLAFIDEAGISKPEHEPFLVVAGVLIHGDNALNGVENELERIMKRHILPVHWDDFVFHATELFNGGGKIFRREKSNLIGPPQWPLERRLRIADEIMAIPKKFALNIAFGFLERAQFPVQFDIPDDWPPGEMVVAQQVSAFSTCTLFIEQWMRRNASGENCLLVVENNDKAKTLLRNIHQWHQSKRVAMVLDEFGKQLLPTRKIRQDPLFQDKRPSNALIVADFCAYVFKRILMNDQRYRRFFDPIRKQTIFFSDGVLKDIAAHKAAGVIK